MDEKDPEVIDPEKEPEKEPEAEPVDVSKLGGLDLDVDLHEDGKASEDEQEKKEPEKKETKPPEPTPKEKEWEERFNRVEKDKRDLQKALHEARQERKKSKEPEPSAVLTDADLMKIVEEHKDDPKVMFNAVAYKVKEMMKTGKAETVNEVEIKQKRDQLSSVLKERIKDFDDEGSEPRVIIGKAKTDFNLEDHPYGDFLGAAAAVYIDLPNLAKGWFEEGKKQALGEKADGARKDGIKKNQPAPSGPKLGGKNASAELTADQMDTAKRLGFTTPEKLRLYKSQILKVANP